MMAKWTNRDEFHFYFDAAYIEENGDPLRDRNTTPTLCGIYYFRTDYFTQKKARIIRWEWFSEYGCWRALVDFGNEKQFADIIRD